MAMFIVIGHKLSTSWYIPFKMDRSPLVMQVEPNTKYLM